MPSPPIRITNDDFAVGFSSSWGIYWVEIAAPLYAPKQERVFNIVFDWAFAQHGTELDPPLYFQLVNVPVNRTRK
ncbi:MAG: hypothetical protein LAO04_08570 [Acidobacteriia bacterium]|nr:hypothetical protein [Terriglobia bacterium]